MYYIIYIYNIYVFYKYKLIKKDLAFKYDISKEDYPVYKLFNRQIDPDSAVLFEGTDRVSNFPRIPKLNSRKL